MDDLPSDMTISELLHAIGLLDTSGGAEPSVDNEESQMIPTNLMMTDPNQSPPGLVGTLPGSMMSPIFGAVPKPKQQPSLFWKAMAYTLTNFLSNATSLQDEGQALFLAAPDQTGVPGGRAFPQEVINYQTFLKADAIQNINHPTYVASGDSYFEYLAIYLRSVTDKSDDRKLRAARSALLDAKVHKDRAYEQARQNYVLNINPSDANRPSFIDSMNKNPTYERAWQRESSLEKTYIRLQGDHMKSVSSQLDQIRDVDDRLYERTSNNRPSVAVSEDYVFNPQVQAGKKVEVDPKDIYYRPFYSLQNWNYV